MWISSFNKALLFDEKNTVETKQWLDKHYLKSAPSRQMVEKWIAEFKRGRTSTNDAERNERPNEAVIPENVKKSPNWLWTVANWGCTS